MRPGYQIAAAADHPLRVGQPLQEPIPAPAAAKPVGGSQRLCVQLQLLDREDGSAQRRIHPGQRLVPEVGRAAEEIVNRAKRSAEGVGQNAVHLFSTCPGTRLTPAPLSTWFSGGAEGSIAIDPLTQNPPGRTFNPSDCPLFRAYRVSRASAGTVRQARAFPGGGNLMPAARRPRNAAEAPNSKLSSFYDHGCLCSQEKASKIPNTRRSHKTTAMTTTAFRIDLMELAIGMKRLTSHNRTPTTIRVNATYSNDI
jgi:hypothetical protein